MPYKLQELNEMSEEQLRALGESLNIKGFKKMDIHTLGFAILDAQATLASQNPAEEPQQKKRGRPRKTDKPAADKPADKPAAEKPAEEKPAATKPAK